MIAGIVALVAPAGAAARVVKLAPPGNSGIGQYVEVVPTAGGGKPTGGVGSGRPAASVIPPAAARALARAGADGRAAAALANATAPSLAALASGSATQPGNYPATGSGGGSSPLSTLARAVTGSSSGRGLGAWLPAILIVVALGGGAIGLRKRLARRST